MKGKPKAFGTSIKPAIESALSAAGLNPGLAEAISAQMALETGNGMSVANNNFGGIKAGASWTGKVAMVPTHEEVNGVLVNKTEPFRVYDSVEDGIKGYVDFIASNRRYASALQARSAADYFTALQKAGYATDSQYARKLLGVFDSIYEN